MLFHSLYPLGTDSSLTINSRFIRPANTPLAQCLMPPIRLERGEVGSHDHQSQTGFLKPYLLDSTISTGAHGSFNHSTSLLISSSNSKHPTRFSFLSFRSLSEYLRPFEEPRVIPGGGQSPCAPKHDNLSFIAFERPVGPGPSASIHRFPNFVN